LIGCPQLLETGGTRRSHSDCLTNTSSNATVANVVTSRYERKINLTFCSADIFMPFVTCYCCQNTRRCYKTRDECRANCPACNPRCPPQPST
ncbi:hypothetical protein BAE44_0023832, partial [Dichanthelium oligosanthes]